MPFTPAHAVVALPFVRSSRWSAAAVASGAIAPDLPLFVSGGAGYEQTHALWAAPTLDLLLGLVLLALWRELVRPGLIAVLPASARARVPARRRAVPALVPVGVVLGALSHIAWDAFTHRHRLGEALIPGLGERVGPFVLTSWLQYASGAVGLAVLAGAAVLAWRTTRPEPVRSRSPLGAATRPARVAAVLLPLVAAAVAVVLAAFATGSWSWSGSAYTATTTLVLWAGAVMAAIGVLVRIRGRRTGR